MKHETARSCATSLHGRKEQRKAGTRESPVRLCDRLQMPHVQESQILRFLIAAMRMPRLTIAVTLLALAVLASTLTYTGFLVVGVVADYLGTGRIVAGLLLGVLLARLPWIVKGKLRLVGLIPKLLRRPFMVSLLTLCLLSFLWRGEYVSAVFTGFATVFLLTFPWLKRAIFDRILLSVSKLAGRNPAKSSDHTVIDGDFREKKE